MDHRSAGRYDWRKHLKRRESGFSGGLDSGVDSERPGDRAWSQQRVDMPSERRDSARAPESTTMTGDHKATRLPAIVNMGNSKYEFPSRYTPQDARSRELSKKFKKPKKPKQSKSPQRSQDPRSSGPTYRKEKPFSEVAGPPRPIPTQAYLAQAYAPVFKISTPRKLLVILDLNGTLLVRPDKLRPHACRLRPGVAELIDYLLNTHSVMIFSSARPANVAAMVCTLLGKRNKDQPPSRILAAIWARDRLGLSKDQYDQRVQVYKRLETVWADHGVQRSAVPGSPWDQSNTVLIDDSHLKAAAQPFNHVFVPEFDAIHKLSDVERDLEFAIMAGLKTKLEVLSLSRDVSSLILRWQTGRIHAPVAPKNKPWGRVVVDPDQFVERTVEVPEVDGHSGEGGNTAPQSSAWTSDESSDEEDFGGGNGISLKGYEHLCANEEDQDTMHMTFAGLKIGSSQHEMEPSAR